MDIDDITDEFEIGFDQVVNDGNEKNLTCTNCSSPETSDDSSSDLIPTSTEVLCDSGPSKDKYPNCLNNSTSQSPLSAQSLSPSSPLAATQRTTSDCPPIPTASPSPQSTPLCSAGVSLVIGNLKWCTELTEIIARLTIGHQVQVCMDDESAYEMCNRQAYSLIWLLVNPLVNQELLSLTTSIRYVSKYNKNTIVIGVSPTKIDVDLKLHGIDETVVQPVTKSIVQNKYSKLTSVQLNEAEQVTTETCSSDTNSCSEDSTNLADVDCDEGIPPHIREFDQYATRLGQTNITTITGQLKSPNISNGHDHTAKEKLRRERIKESCGQLRVLLPYVRGRKTDMASILELGVNYIKIVNTILPQELQSQITNILSKDYIMKENTMKSNQPNIASSRKTTAPVQKVIKTNKDQDYTSNKLTPVSEFCHEGQVQRLNVKSVSNNSAANVATSPVKRPNSKMDGTTSAKYLETNDTHLQYAVHKEPRLEMTGTAESDEITILEYKKNFKDNSIPSRMTTTVSTNSKPIQSSILNSEIRLIPVVNDNANKKNYIKQELPIHMCPYSIPLYQANECFVHKQIAPVGPQTQLFCPPRQYVNYPNLCAYPSSYFGNSEIGQTDGNFVAGKYNFNDNEFEHSNIPMYYHCSNNEAPKSNSTEIVQMSDASQSSFYRSRVDEPLPADYPLNTHLDTLRSNETNELFNGFMTLANTPTKTSDISLHE
ncbi:uncharacterized protein LOC106876877 isoform X2 [Octopus bimaculoides]|uniref:BHLH domain-containing protein n=1 Tax=Octopus bimaculoides TaxID=37653 RepID=A0A0L8IAW0_OCTBM|nr:uncharacterized protein LOC106876877 isoform X2 [Octopus bimaculoides]|eukprot:XP_014781115.1 PREDICTED: uncharacterized protein LOC106876877 isoform X2 [Octopus bimaculoides]